MLDTHAFDPLSCDGAQVALAGSKLTLLILVLALLSGGWLAFDGAHALMTGDYVTPSSGRFAGQLGPWSQLVSAVGIEPRSTLMMSIHVGLGMVWLVAIAAFVLGRPWAWAAMLTCAALGLWYLPFGTLLSVIQIVLLLLPATRSHAIRHSAESARD